MVAIGRSAVDEVSRTVDDLWTVGLGALRSSDPKAGQDGLDVPPRDPEIERRFQSTGRTALQALIGGTWQPGSRTCDDRAMADALLDRPPFALRARILTPLADGGTRFEPDGLLTVGPDGTIAAVESWDPAVAGGAAEIDVLDIRPDVILPGLVDLHLHLPQVPNAGLGAGMDLLAWLQRYIFPLEEAFDADTARREMPAILAALAAVGTTTVVGYGAIWQPSLDAAFEAAEEHGIRAIFGKVMMDRGTYDRSIDPATILEVSLRQTAELVERWHGRDHGRLQYAVTPRFAVSCSADMLRESASLARATGAYWQTHLSEDARELMTVTELFPGARDYLDVYDQAGALGPRTILAHGIHLSDREIARIVGTGSRIVHCPESNQFLASGRMRLARYLDRGMVVGLGSDVAAGPDPSLFRVMRAGTYSQNAERAAGDRLPVLDPLGWLRLGTYEGARALGLEKTIGSLEPGKEADLLVVDPVRTSPLPNLEVDEPADLMSRLIFRTHPEMIRAAYVRGRRLPTA